MAGSITGTTGSMLNTWDSFGRKGLVIPSDLLDISKEKQKGNYLYKINVYCTTSTTFF